MVTEHGNELYHSNHLLPGNNVMVNQYTIHLRRAKPNTCHSKPFLYGFRNLICAVILIPKKTKRVQSQNCTLIYTVPGTPYLRY